MKLAGWFQHSHRAGGSWEKSSSSKAGSWGEKSSKGSGSTGGECALGTARAFVGEPEPEVFQNPPDDLGVLNRDNEVEKGMDSALLEFLGSSNLEKGALPHVRILPAPRSSGDRPLTA